MPACGRGAAHPCGLGSPQNRQQRGGGYVYDTLPRVVIARRERLKDRVARAPARSTSMGDLGFALIITGLLLASRRRRWLPHRKVGVEAWGSRIHFQKWKR
jgi:hypothetical protein